MRINNTQTNYFYGNAVFQGGLSALSGAVFTNTIFTSTSALSVINTGIGPALYVAQAPGDYDIASFYDKDGIEVLHVGNAPAPGAKGKIGINVSFPGAELTVNGAISGNDGITAAGGNSNNWNSVYTSFNTQSAANASVYTTANTMSANNASVYTTTNANSANWNEAYNRSTSYPQLTAINYTPYNLLGPLTTNTTLFTVPAGRKFICKSFGLNIIEISAGTASASPSIKLVNVTRGNTGIANSLTPSLTLDNTYFLGNTNNIAASAGDVVALRMTGSAITGVTVLSASMFIEGYLI